MGSTIITILTSSVVTIVLNLLLREYFKLDAAKRLENYKKEMRLENRKHEIQANALEQLWGRVHEAWCLTSHQTLNSSQYAQQITQAIDTLQGDIGRYLPYLPNRLDILCSEYSEELLSATPSGITQAGKIRKEIAILIGNV